ncbi:MAG: NnrU family protein [Acidiphilium sp.]
MQERTQANMLLLILGLVIFLGTHSIRIFADDWRRRQIDRLGPQGWRGVYSVVSLAGLALIIVGFGAARAHPELLYAPPAWLRHLNIVFTLVAFVLVAAAYVPHNHIKAKIGHPMLAGVKAWAFGHLLATGMLRDVVLFGAFLVWAIVDFAASRRRDRAARVVYPAGSVTGDVAAVVIGVVVWLAFAFWLHTLLIGANPLA